MALSADVVISAAVKLGLAFPSFSYQAMVLSSREAERISISPSPSISAAKTENAPSADVAISAAVKVGETVIAFCVVKLKVCGTVKAPPEVF